MQNYTLPQIRAFLDGLDCLQRSETRSRLIAARAAQAKQDDFKRILKEIG